MHRRAFALCLLAACESPPVDVGETLDSAASAAEMGDDATATTSTSAGEGTADDDGTATTTGAGDATPCDPFTQDCPDLQGCYVVGDAFGCLPDASGDADLPGTPCDAPNACAPTMLCLDCGDADCCVRVCILTAPECANGETCTPYFPIDEAPLGLDDIGTCMPAG